MIKTKEELREYLRRDNGGWGQKPFLYRLIKRIGGSENYRIKEFFRILRHYEFYLNGRGILSDIEVKNRDSPAFISGGRIHIEKLHICSEVSKVKSERKVVLVWTQTTYRRQKYRKTNIFVQNFISLLYYIFIKLVISFNNQYQVVLVYQI